MRKLLFALVLLASPAWAQTTVKQTGTITPGHVAAWISNGVIKDAGTAQNGNLTSVGVIASGPAICQNSGPITGPYNQLCLGTTQTGGGVISLFNYAGGSGALTFNINGSIYNFPFAVGGNVLGPSVTTVGHLATWNNTNGTLLADTTTLSAAVQSSITQVGTITTGVWNGTAVAVANGGTGATTKAAALVNLFPTPVRAGDVVYWNGSAWVTLAGATGIAQTLQETGGNPSWTNININSGTQGQLALYATAGQALSGVTMSGDATFALNGVLTINTFGTATSGKVPASGGGTVNVLRANATWGTIGSGTVVYVSGDFAANGAVATAITSVGPTGSHTTVQKWLKVLDQTSATFYIPLF